MILCFLDGGDKLMLIDMQCHMERLINYMKFERFAPNNIYKKKDINIE